MRRIDPKSKLMQEFIYTQKAMPVDRPVVQYIRQSNPGQVKHNLQSKIQQDGNLSRLGRECLATGFSFPNFEGVEKIPHIALKLDGNKYPVHTRGALHSILTNPAYIGWYVFSRTEDVKNEHGAQIIENGKVKTQKIATVVSKTAHDAIVPMSDFMFAYNRLSSTTLEGEINEDRPAINRRYGVGCEALLEGIVESDGKPVYVMAHNQTYTARTFNDGWKTTELVIKVQKLDTAFMGAVRFLLAVLEYQHEIGDATGLQEKIIELLNEKAEEASTLEHDINNVEKGIREWELAKRVAMGEEYEAGVVEATRQLKKLHADKAAIEARTKHVDAESEDLTELQGLLDRVMHAWGGMTFGLKRRFITMTVEKANIREETPHIIRIDVDLKEPIKYRFTGYMFRHRGSKPKWTGEEMAVLKRMYKQADRLEILKALPTRTWASIMGQSMTMGLERTTRLNTSGIHEALTYADVELMQQIGMKDTKQAIWKHNPEIETLIVEFDTILNLFESGGIDALRQNGFLDSLLALVEEFCTAMKVRRWG